MDPLALGCMVFLNFVAVVFSLLSYLKVRENAVRVEMLQKAPVLRQYVERFVPVKKNESEPGKMTEAMKDAERAFDEAFGEVPPEAMRKVPERVANNILRAEELV